MTYFVAVSTARTTADLIGIHRNTAVRFFHKLREKIALKQQHRSEQFCGKSTSMNVILTERAKENVVEVPLEKVLFGLLKHGGKVSTQIILDAKLDALMPIIREKIEPDSIVCTDCWRGTTHSIFLNSSILGLTTAPYLLKSLTTSTVLKTFGIMLNIT